MKPRLILLVFFIFVTCLGVYSSQDMPSKNGLSKEITVYQSKTCSCCKKWVSHLTEHGMKVKSVLLDDVTKTKQYLGVPKNLTSCHTALVGGYVIEGHVPASAITQLLTKRPRIKGIAVPGMPMGSPGMEGSYSVSYDVIAFNLDQTQSYFAKY